MRGPSYDRRVRVLVAIAIWAACTPAAPRPISQVAPVATGIPPLPGTGDRAYVADDTGLVEVAPPGTSQVIAKDDVRWCSTDARARVVWFVTERGLFAFDLD